MARHDARKQARRAAQAAAKGYYVARTGAGSADIVQALPGQAELTLGHVLRNEHDWELWEAHPYPKGAITYHSSQALAVRALLEGILVLA